MKRAVRVEFEMVSDCFYQGFALIVIALGIEEDEIILLLVADTRRSLDMQRKLEDRLPIRRLALETRQRARKCLKVEVVDGILDFIKPKAHLLLVDMLGPVVKTVALNFVILIYEPVCRDIVELPVTLVDKLILILDATRLETAEMYIIIGLIGVRNTSETLEALAAERTFRPASPGAPLADRNFGRYVLRRRNVAIKRCHLLCNNRLILLRHLIHVQEYDDLLAVNLIVHALSHCISNAIILVLAIENSQIVIHGTGIANLAKSMFNHEALECQVMRILAHIAEAVQQGLFLGIKIFAVGRGLHLDDVDLLFVLVVDIHVAAVSVSVEFVFEEFLSMNIL